MNKISRCRDLSPESFEIGAVLKVLWNPIHRYDANLIVLDSQNIIRSFDLINSYKTPDQTIDLNSHSVHPQLSEFEAFSACSIALGTKSDPHGPFTLYVLSRDGDMYALCPFVPSTFVLTQNQLEELFDLAVAEEHEYRHSEGSELIVRKHYKRQLDWAADIWKQASLTVVETRLSEDGLKFEEFFVLQRPSTYLNPQLQGPFSFEPYPDEFYNYDAVDVETVDNGACTVILTTYSNGSILIALQVHSIDLNWAVLDASVDLTLFVIESILPAEAANYPNNYFRPGIFVPPESKNTVYILNSRFIHRINMDAWCSQIKAALDEGVLEDVETIVQNSPSSEVTTLLQVRDETYFGGVAEVKALVKSIIIATNDHVWLEVINEGIIPELLAKKPLDRRDSNLSEITKKRERTYLDDPFNIDQAFKRLTLNNRQFPLPPRDISVNSPIVPDDSMLKYFDQVGEFFSAQAAQLHSIGYLMYNRLQAQRNELHRQVTKLDECYKNIIEPLKDKVSRKERLAEIISRQQKLEERLHLLHTRVSSASSNPRSMEERKWKEELERLEKSISGTRGLESRVQNVSFFLLFFFFLLTNNFFFLQI